MILRLCALPDSLRGPDDPAYKGQVPRRARFLAPDAALSLLRLVGGAAPWLTMTDVYRSPEASLAAMRRKRGVQPPGFSGHNFGLSVDLDVGACLRAGNLRYPALTNLMAGHGWHCHRRDLDSSAQESWHFNYFGDASERLLALADAGSPHTWARPLERWITDRHGTDFAYDDDELQRQLAKLGLYRGELDGRAGPLTREAVAAFQRAWLLEDDGIAGPRTRRVLAVVASEIELVPPPSPVG